MKVIHLISGGDTGGAKTHVHSLLHNLSQSIEVTLVCFRAGPFAEEAAAMGIDTRVMDGGFFRALRQVKGLVESGGYDIIHCHGSRANLAGAILRAGTKKPVVSTVHSDYKLDYLGRPAAALTYGKLNILALRHIKYHIGVSDAMRSLLISRGFPRSTTFSIYNGLDFSREVPRRDRRAFYERVGAHVESGDVVVGAAARLDPVKDLGTLVRGFAEAKKAVPGLRLIIAGEGAERGALEALAAELGVADSVTLAGWLDDMDEYYGSIDINALSSISETFPYAITEGAAHRLPTVSSRVGGIPRLVEDTVTGYLFEPGRLGDPGRQAGGPGRRRGAPAAAGGGPYSSGRRGSSPWRPPAGSSAPYMRRYCPARPTAGAPACWSAGAYGMGNAGDEAILDAITAELRSIDPLMPITVLSRDPEGAERRLDVDALHTFNVPGFLRAMRRRVLYINGGGSLIQDVTSRRSLWFYLFTLRSARAMGCRVMMYGCGIGPVKRPGGVRSTRRTISSCVDIITLREPDSMEELRRFGVEGPEMILSSDPALTLSPAPAEEIDAAFNSAGAEAQGRYICFALRSWPGFEEKAPAIAAAARYAHERYGLTPAFVSINHRSDGEAAGIVAASLEGVPHVLIPGPMPSDLAIGVMSRMEIVVSMRLHGLIFAAGQGVPLVGVSYDPKVTAFLRCVDGGCTSLEELTGPGLCALIDEAAAKRGDRAALEASVERLRALEHRNTESAARLLGKGGA